MTYKTATAVINREALINNFQQIKALAPDTKMLAVLKANGYGHGLELIAKTLPLADAFGVARIDEALALRAAGITQPIVLLEGFFSPEDLAVLAVNDLQTIVHNQQQLDSICQAELVRPVKVWLKIDTGMHRLGINPEEFDHFYHALKNNRNVQQPIILMSHLGCADDVDAQETHKQLALFNELTAHCLEEKSLANSAGTYAWPSTRFDWIRPGLILYGVSPMSKPTARVNSSEDKREETEFLAKITPVMTLQSSLIAIRKIAAGESVGYGSAWHCTENTIIGVIAIGYGDGYPRHAGNGTPVLVNGRRVPIVGRVSMDMITVDLGASSQDSVGDLATLWGIDLPIEEIAQCATTIPYELLCNITRRVQIDVI